MNRDLKLFFIVIGLPALLLALGGLRFLMMEAENARNSGRQTLQAKASYVAEDVRRRVRAYVSGVFDRIDQLPVKTDMALQEIAAMEPLVRSVKKRSGVKAGFCRRHGIVIELDEEAVRAAIPEWLHENGAISPDADGIDKATTAGLRTNDGRVVFPAPKTERGVFFASAPLGVEVPDTRVCIGWRYAAARESEAGLRVYAIGAAVLGLLLAALLSGAWLLVRAAQRARLEARRQTDFTAGVSHEFKTPITAIQLAAEFAEPRAAEPEVRQALKDIQEEAAHLSHLVADVLDIGRLADGRPLAVERVDVGGGVMAWANTTALRHIHDNLEENARKYAPGAPTERRVRVENGHVFIEVMDRGPGMSSAEMKHAFERYWRADKTVIRTKGGVGLGLPIARRLARAMGGDLTVASREGGGCVFTITLRKAEAENG